MSTATNNETIRQAAVIPVRDGMVCLVTSSSGKRWVIPEGKIDPLHTATEAALVEAWEEAGLVGRIIGDAIGSYLYKKLERVYHVTVFVMEVTSAAETWPEQTRRQREWLDVESAVSRVSDEGLPPLIRAAVNPEALAGVG